MMIEMSDNDHAYVKYFLDENLELENYSIVEESNDSNVGDFVDTLDELIIACVQSYSHLYNKSDKNYKDNMMKEKSWEEIAKTCNTSGIFLKSLICKNKNILEITFKSSIVNEVQERWKRVKDRYGKQRRLNDRAMRSGSAAKTIKQWPLFESMKFMEKHIQRRRYKLITNQLLQ